MLTIRSLAELRASCVVVLIACSYYYTRVPMTCPNDNRRGVFASRKSFFDAHYLIKCKN